MKAIVQTSYGSPDLLQLQDVPQPVPQEGQVLLKVLAASLNSADWRMLVGDPAFLRLASISKGRIPGADVAGRVQAVGAGVTQFKPGDEVFGDTFDSGMGALAEYVCARESSLVLKPAAMSFEQAAALPVAGITALQALRDKGRIRAGQKVLVNGSSGGVGTFALQMAKAFGAEVTAVCSTKNLELAASLGADHLIDYTREDFTKNGQRYDLILGVNGYHSILDYRRSLNPGGVYVMAGGSMKQIIQALLLGPLLSMGGSRKMTAQSGGTTQKDLLEMAALFEAGKLKPVIDRCYRLEETPEALRYLGLEHARGKVIIADYAG